MNEIEKEILEIIIKISYNDKKNSIIENRRHGIKFPLNIDMPPNYRVINAFNTYYFDKYKYCLFENALIYAYSIKDKSYIDYYTYAIKNKEDIELADSFYLMKTTEFAVLNIKNKQYNKKNIDKKIKTKYKDSFNKLNELFVSIQTITQFCRKQIIEFVNLFPNIDCNDILYTLIKTNKLDSEFIKYTNNSYDKNTIVSYKKLLCILILSDNYLSIKALEVEDELDDHIDDLLDNSDYNSKELNEEETDDEEDLYNKEIIVNYIEESVKNNNIRIPTDTELLGLMFTNFFNYNECELCKEYDIDMIEQDEKSLAVLKKINPLYKFDCFDGE